jgi:Tfp pilus assembly protein PilE
VNTWNYSDEERVGAVREGRQAGASLVEAVLFLVVVVVILLGIFALFSGAFSASKVQTEMSYMQTLAGDVESLYATNHDYGAADITSALTSTRNAPTPMIVGANLVNSWGGQVTVTGASTVFTIASTNIPQKECIQLAQVSINPTSVTINGAAQALPLAVAPTTAACSSATANTITWSVR